MRNALGGLCMTLRRLARTGGLDSRDGFFEARKLSLNLRALHEGDFQERNYLSVLLVGGRWAIEIMHVHKLAQVRRILQTTVFIVVLRIAVYIRIIRGVRYCTCLT